MKKSVALLKDLGEKIANKSIGPLSIPYWAYQPKPPAKIQAKMKEMK